MRHGLFPALERQRAREDEETRTRRRTRADVAHVIVRDRPAVVGGHDGGDDARERVPIGNVIRARIARVRACRRARTPRARRHIESSSS